MSGDRSQCDYHKPDCTHYCENGHVTADEYVVCDGARLVLEAENARLRVVAEAGRAFVHGTYPDGRPYKGGDLTNAVRAMEEAA